MPLSELVADLPEDQLLSPRFTPHYIRDYNPMTRHTKRRLIEQPNDAMRLVHTRLRRRLRRMVDRLPHATGAIKGSSPYHNVRRHRHNQFLFLTDIHGAYQQVDPERLAEIILELKPDFADSAQELVDFLMRYCMSEIGGLATGAPASPDLFNLYAGVLIDETLAAYCSGRKIIYTRYLDDLTFSTAEPFGPVKRPQMLDLVRAGGFTTADRKTKVYDLALQAVEINGIGLELGGRIFLPRWFLKRVDHTLQRAITTGDVPPEEVAGMVGVFWSVAAKPRATRHLSLNKTELAVARKIAIWKQQQKRRRARALARH